MKLWVKIVPAIASNIPATPPDIANIVSSEGFPISIHKKLLFEQWHLTRNFVLRDKIAKNQHVRLIVVKTKARLLLSLFNHHNGIC